MINHYDQVRDYLGDRLSEDDRDAFEIAMLEDGELQSAVVIERAIKRELGAVKRPVNPRPAPHARGNFSAGWAIAASLCLCVSLAFNLLPRGGSKLSSIDDIVYVEPMRSSDTQTYRIDAAATTLLSVAVSDPRVRDVAIAFRGPGLETPVGTFAVSDDGLVNIVVPDLPPGMYQLTLSSERFEDVYSLDVN